jgi:sec-independent protein translocase protein TatA
MGLSWPHILIVLLLFLLLFGRGKISDLMGDVAKGIKSFKRGLAEDDERPEPEPEIVRAAPKSVEHKKAPPAARRRKTAASAKPKTTRGRKSG